MSYETRTLKLSSNLEMFYFKAEQMISISTRHGHPSESAFKWEWDEASGYSRLELNEFGIVLERTHTDDYRTTEIKAGIESQFLTSNFENSVRKQLESFAEKYCFRMDIPDITIVNDLPAPSLT